MILSCFPGGSAQNNDGEKASCTLRFVRRNASSVKLFGYFGQRINDDGKIEPFVVDLYYDDVTEWDITVENVLCGSIFGFALTYLDVGFSASGIEHYDSVWDGRVHITTVTAGNGETALVEFE